jgi:hypothetical protein
MNVIDKLASSLGSRDEVPNQELAALVIKKNDVAAVKELVRILTEGNKAQQGDAIKTLYEIGYVKPEMISKYIKDFLALLDSKTIRLQWGAMMALDTIATIESKAIYAALPKILDIAKQGSVITRDHAVGILAKLSAVKAYADDAFPLLLDEIKTAPLNQFPSYVERAMEVARDKDKPFLLKAINARLPEVEKESSRKRLMKVLKKLDLP